MADDNEGTEESTDPQSAFIDRMAAKYEKVDAKTMNRSDSAADADGAGEDEDAGTDADDDEEAADSEHADADTSADNPDGDAVESEADSEDDAEEHTDDDADEADDTDSDDDADAADDDAEGDEKDEDSKEDDDEEEEETEKSLEATKTALRKAGADVKIDDVPEKYRPIVDKKLASINAAFTRTMQEQTAFRKERLEFQAEERFRTQNLPLYIVEQLRKNPKLMDEVNGELDKLGTETDTEDVKALKGKAYDDSVASKRKSVRDAAEKEYNDAIERVEKAQERGVDVDRRARAMADKAGVPFRIVEKQILLEIKERQLANKEADFTDDELASIVATEAKEFKPFIRQQQREQSKKRVQDRAGNRRGVAPAARKVGAVAPGASGKKKEVVDHNSEESRQAAMMRTARRLAPGAREK